MAASEPTSPPDTTAEAKVGNGPLAAATLSFPAEQGLLTMANSAGVGVIIYDRELRILFWNAFMENLTGRKADEVLGQYTMSLFPHLRDQGVDRFFHEALAGRTVTSGDTPFTVPGTGKSGWVQGIYSPHVAGDGAIVGLVAIIHDITVRKNLEEELRTKEEFLRGVLNSVQDGISVLDCDMNILMTNPTQEKRYATSMPLLGKKCFQMYQQRQQVCTWCPSVRALRSGERQNATVPYPNAKNPTGWLELTAFPLRNTRGEIVGVVEHNRDITARLAMEQELRTKEEFLQGVLDSVQDVISVVDRDLNIVLSNPSLDGMYPRELPMRGKKCFKVFHQSDKACATCPAQEAMRTGFKGSKIAPYPDNQSPTNWLEVTAFPLRNIEGEIIGAVEYARDVTDQKKTDERLAQQKAFLETIIESLPNPFCVINAADYQVVMANSLASQQREWQGLTCHQLTHHRDTPCDGFEHRCPLEEVKRTGEPVIVEHEHYDSRGSKRYIEVHGYPILDDQGQVVQMIEYGLDITDRRLFEEEMDRLVVDLQRALKEVKTLSGLLPICAWCKKIRDDKGYWNQIESYMGRHTEAQFSHSICPDCMQTNFPDLDDDK